MEQDELLPIDGISGNFHHFLQEVKNNKRIFFSGRFGTGKTYFLKEFFSSFSENYEVFHLFPINYQINESEDIVDLLKYDILIELLDKNGEIFDENRNSGIADNMALFLSFCREKGSINGFLQSIIESTTALSDLSPNPLMQFLSKLGHPMQDLLKMDKEFQRFKKEYKSGEKGIVKKFTDEMNCKNILETDYLSQILSEKIIQQKGEKKSVLILDDMDRIDPQHIFRLLNVFSAHFDDENIKFNFDHVVIVGDIENIKNIFRHKYGEKSDFWGYFDKFFTVRPYYLDNKKIIKEYIPKLIKKIKCDEENLKESIGESGYIKLLLEDVLIRSLNVDGLNLRQLFKPIKYNFPELRSGVFSQDHFRDNFQQVFDIGIWMLVAIFGSQENLVSVLDSIERDIKDSDKDQNAPYERYIATMVKMLHKITPGIEQNIGSYKFTVAVDNNYGLEINGSEAEKVRFFYSTLIEYISQSKHYKGSFREYMR